ncbi:MAG: phosphate signaling complex protein PhoU [Limisphaerales bacterium]
MTPICDLSTSRLHRADNSLRIRQRLDATLNTQSHLEESLQRDIGLLRAKITEMAALVESALKVSLQAMLDRNRRLAYSVILRDQYIDELETEVDRLCLEFLIRHQPAGTHLRFVYATIQINKALERIGDYAESIARQVLVISAIEPQPSYSKFVELADLSLHMVRDAVQSFLRQDADLALRTMSIEERANSLRTAINEDLAELSRQNHLPTTALNPLMTVARRLERSADQAKNLCEDVLYLCTGEFVKHKKADGFRILFLDWTNSCLGQMAEGLGKSLGLPRVAFASAGRVPQPIDPRVVKFMAGKRIDISQQSSKSLEQVLKWEDYQVIVALGARALEGLPIRSNKPILLTWPIKDPSEEEGFADDEAAFESAYQALELNLRELAAAIFDEPQPELKL